MPSSDLNASVRTTPSSSGETATPPSTSSRRSTTSPCTSPRKSRFAPLLTAVAEIQALMVSRDAVEAFGDDGIASNIEAAIGTGGMQHVSREADVLTVLERNPNYFREGLPYFDGFRANWNLDGRIGPHSTSPARPTSSMFRGWASRRRTRPCGPRSARRTSSKCPCKRPGKCRHTSTPRSSPTPTRACASPCISPPTGNNSTRCPKASCRSAGRSPTRAGHTRGPSTSSASCPAIAPATCASRTWPRAGGCSTPAATTRRACRR